MKKRSGRASPMQIVQRLKYFVAEDILLKRPPRRFIEARALSGTNCRKRGKGGFTMRHTPNIFREYACGQTEKQAKRLPLIKSSAVSWNESLWMTSRLKQLKEDSRAWKRISSLCLLLLSVVSSQAYTAEELRRIEQKYSGNITAKEHQKQSSTGSA